MNTAGWPKADGTRAQAPPPADFAPSCLAPSPPAAAGTASGWPPEAGTAALPRLWRMLMAARLLLALALLGLQTHAWWNGAAPGWIVALCLAHTGVCTAAAAMPAPHTRPDARSLRWLPTVWADLGVFASLQLLTAGGLNFTPLFVWPVLQAAVLGPRLLALGSAAAGTLALLAEAWLGTGSAAETTRWLQAAVTGSGLLLVGWLSSHLTARLIGEQTAAQRHRQLAVLQGMVNHTIVTGLREGVIVLDARGQPWYANHAALHMLGVPPAGAAAPNPAAASDAAAEPPPSPVRALRDTPGWRVLAGWACAAASSDPAERVRDLTLPLPDGGQQRVRARAHPVLPAPPTPGATVVFLDDLHAIEQRVRTEKLAAMGRVSAAVAHEIRNPLAAIAQASALLQEDDPTPAQQRLLTLIEQNVRRLGRTVDDVLESARVPGPDGAASAAPLVLDEAIDAIVADWLRQRPQGVRLRLVRAAGAAAVAFDPDHLRRVLVNLLDNADRHASAQPGAIRVDTCADARQATLTVWSDSPPIDPTVRQHLFEPFVSSHSRSSGLGLYLSRELCQRYHADLSHERTERDGRRGNAFVIRMPVIDIAP
ncbi:Sensor protein ZraS [Tepidimonas thermarum]|uniref:histidine kinase n=1 Tax=Tepidimonas thermarum TaxID=335431 RepID=A0A554WXA4_9BURK|nr:HAMP domain-containing sensor histidine kinase [Tepidimonas thermarum]TSE28205.1 Sensor protein ZraS [Tepidimonas thermarum]